MIETFSNPSFPAMAGMVISGNMCPAPIPVVTAITVAM